MIQNVHTSSDKVLQYFNKILILFDRFSKNPQRSNVMQIHPVGNALFHADRQTDGYRLTDGQGDRRDGANKRL